MKVGDYVRTKSGEIAKIDECKGKDKLYKNMEYYETDRMVTKFNDFTLYKENIKKSSSNIIDLIEAGDYVNGERITRVIPEDVCGDEVLDYQHIFVEDKEIYCDEIKSILTKEQFEAMKYEIK